MEHENNGEDRRELDSKRFRLDTTVSVAHILTTLALLFKLFEWGGSVETRFTHQGTQIEAIIAARAEAAKNTQQALVEIKTDVRQVNDKLDRLILRK